MAYDFLVFLYCYIKQMINKLSRVKIRENPVVWTEFSAVPPAISILNFGDCDAAMTSQPTMLQCGVCKSAGKKKVKTCRNGGFWHYCYPNQVF